MTDAEVDVDYGRIVDTRYDEEGQQWLRARIFGQEAPLQPFGGVKTLIRPSVALTDNQDEQETYPRALPQLLSAFPDLAPAEQLINDIAHEENANSRKNVNNAGFCELASFSSVGHWDGISHVPLIAYATGIRNNKLRVVRGGSGREGWQKDFVNALATTHFQDAHACELEVSDNEILQIRTSDLGKQGQTLVAIRHPQELTILRISLGRETREDLRPRRSFYFKIITRFHHFQSKIRDVTDMSFNPQDMWHLATTHVSGLIRFWKLSRSRHKPCVLIKTLDTNVLPGELQHARTTPRLLDGIILLDESYVVCRSGNLILFWNLSGAGEELSLHPQVIDAQSRVLSIQRLSPQPNMFIALTTCQVIWMSIQSEDDKPGSATTSVLQAWSHNRDTHDASLKLSLVCEIERAWRRRAGVHVPCAAFLYSQQTKLVTEYRFTFCTTSSWTAPPSLQVSDPIPFPLNDSFAEDQQSSMLYLGLSLTPFRSQRQYHSLPGPGLSYYEEGVHFFQALFFCRDRSLKSVMYYQAPVTSGTWQIEELSWRRTLGPRAPLSGPTVLEPGFVVDSEWELDEDFEEDEHRHKWWERPRRVQLDHEAADIPTKVSFERIHGEVMRYEHRPPTHLASNLDNLLEYQHDHGDEMSQPADLWASITGLGSIPDDIFGASQRLEELFGTDNVLNGHPRSLNFTSIPALDLSASLIATTESLANTYKDLLDNYVTRLPKATTHATRAAYERRTRQYAASLKLSSTMVSSQPLSAPGGTINSTPSKARSPPLSSQSNDNLPFGSKNHDGFPSSKSSQSEQPDSNDTELLNSALHALQHYTSVTTPIATETDHSTTANRILSVWTPGAALDSSSPSIDLTLFDNKNNSQQAEDDVAHQARQARKAERERIRSEGRQIPTSSQSALPTSQPSQASVPLPPSSQPTMDSSQLPSSTKRSSLALSSQAGLPVRKKRRAGF